MASCGNLPTVSSSAAVVVGQEQAVLGAVLVTHGDGTFDTAMGLILVTDIDDRGTCRWYQQPTASGSHPAGSCTRTPRNSPARSYPKPPSAGQVPTSSV
ncbi:hypothetical protein ACFRMQ_00280 [Kitasatospora sp. NPDC056783]|uniref:hypothetical protein n=1 Tax=Kitasatospora sp. NPDC056783 TaxID=3345943 RepID=UPI0036CFBB2D